MKKHLLAIAMLALGSTAHAENHYTYTGTNYDSFYTSIGASVYNTSQAGSITFYVDSALAASSTYHLEDVVTKWYVDDGARQYQFDTGVTTISGTITTDAQGKFSDWSFLATWQNSASSEFYTSAYNGSPTFTKFDGSNGTFPGNISITNNVSGKQDIGLSTTLGVWTTDAVFTPPSGGGTGGNPPVSSVPEPSAFALMLVGLPLLMRRKTV